MGARAHGGRFRWLMRTSLKRRWRITDSNLKICFPELSTEERETLAREHFRNFALALIDFLILPVRSPAFWHQRLTIKGMEHLERVKAQGRGACCCRRTFCRSLQAGASLPPGPDGRGLFWQILGFYGAHLLQHLESVL